MIKSIKIGNFESHKNTFLKFKKSVNIISGKSDHGKSAAFRAFKWVLRNKPSSDSFRSHWGGATGVEIKFSDGHILKRSKGRENTYVLDKKKYKSFGQNIPEDIEKITKISDINLQSQFSPPFLLTNSSGEAARFLNSIVNLEDIDTAQSNIKKIINVETQTLNGAIVAKEELEKDICKYDWIEEAEKEIEELEHSQEEIIELKNKKELIEVAIFDIIDEQEKISILQKLDIKGLNNLLTQIEVKNKKIKSEILLFKKLQENICSIEEEQEEIIKLQEEIEHLNKEYKKLFPNECPLCGRG